MTWQAMSGDGTAGQVGVPRTLRILGLTAVCVLVAALAIATFILSYQGIKAFALQAGIAPSHAKYYPLLLDATLVIVLAALLGLRGAGLPSRFLCWLTLLAVLGAAAAADAMHATKHKLPHQDAATSAAILPWALLFVAILLLLSLVRQARRRRRAEERWRAWQASTVPLTLDPDLLTMPAPTAELPVQTAQPWQSPSIVPGFSPGPLPAAAAPPPAAPPAPPLSPAPETSAAIPETAIPEPPAAIPEPPAAIPEPSAGRGTLWGQDQQQSGDVLASGSGYSGSAKPVAEAPPDEIDTIQPETATQQPHPDQVAADLAGQHAEAADAADVEPDEAVEPSAADQPTDGDEPIDTQQRRSGGAGRAAIAGLRNFRPWRSRGGVAADEATTTETDRIAAETGEPSAVADQPADAEERSDTQEERSDTQEERSDTQWRRVTSGLRKIRPRRGRGDVTTDEDDVPAEEKEGAAEPGQPPAGPDEPSKVQRRLGEAGRAAIAGLRNIRPRRGRGDVTTEEDDVPAEEKEGPAEPGQPSAGPDEPGNVQRRLGEAGRAAMAGLRNIRPRRGRGDLHAEDEPTAETDLPPASATEQADQAQQDRADEDLEADPAGDQPDATEDPVADVADPPPARQA
ncbi:MAG: DUF2637 domain-containing protein [Actinobacteria bacterium]|nr:DUF2637 domain-containing protein [Actinomycetota bacterium]